MASMLINLRILIYFQNIIFLIIENPDSYNKLHVRTCCINYPGYPVPIFQITWEWDR